MTANAGVVSVGITSDTAEFAVQSIRCWLERMGRQRYPHARGRRDGPHNPRPPLSAGTSKWNKIEHRPFCHITQIWHCRPLTDRLAVVELIGATTTKSGLKVESALDTRTYQKGIKVSKAQMNCLDITGDQFHPERNYTIRPRPLQS
jgi:Rhodopirellula transposase DDE domain